LSDDIRVETGFLDHPKTRRLTRRLGDGGLVALIRLWLYASRFFPKGILTGFIPGDIEEAAGWAGAPGEFVLALMEAGGPGRAGFLDLAGDVYSLHNWRRRQSFAYFRPERSAQAQRANDARWGKIREEKQRVDPDRIPDGIQGGSPDRNPPLPPPLPKDLKKDLLSKPHGLDSHAPLLDDSDSRNGTAPAPAYVKAFFDLWNAEAVSLPKARELSAARCRAIKARMKERPLEAWREVFRRMNASRFLCGGSGGGFRADFSWILASGNALKVIEGRYDDRKGGNFDGSRLGEADGPTDIPGGTKPGKYSALCETAKVRGSGS